MRTSFETLSYDALLVEQAEVQVEKFQGRTLTHYSQLIFPTQHLPKPRGSAVVDFVKPLIGDIKTVSLETVVKSICEANNSNLAYWVDMGGGRALPMRQLATHPYFQRRLKMINVDIFDYGLDRLSSDELRYLEGLAPGMTEVNSEPILISDNIETVKLSEPADLITCIEVMQYLDNPLEALSNFYNQLNDNGIMFVATQHEWADWIQYDKGLIGQQYFETPVEHLLKALSHAGINYAVTSESDWKSGLRPKIEPSQVRIMAIKKKPHTKLLINNSVTNVRINPWNFKSTYYDYSEEGLVKVESLKSESGKKLGTICVKT